MYRKLSGEQRPKKRCVKKQKNKQKSTEHRAQSTGLAAIIKHSTIPRRTYTLFQRCPVLQIPPQIAGAIIVAIMPSPGCSQASKDTQENAASLGSFCEKLQLQTILQLSFSPDGRHRDHLSIVSTVAYGLWWYGSALAPTVKVMKHIFRSEHVWQLS